LLPSWGSIFWETVCRIFWIPIRPTRQDKEWSVYSWNLIMNRHCFSNWQLGIGKSQISIIKLQIDFKIPI
jgi:hypothetical protein